MALSQVVVSCGHRALSGELCYGLRLWETDIGASEKDKGSSPDGRQRCVRC